MDQWEKVKFDTDYGTIYVTISHRDDYPDSFDNIWQKNNKNLFNVLQNI